MDERRATVCRVCGWNGSGQWVLSVAALEDETLNVVRCDDCGSLQILEHSHDASNSDAAIDDYVECGAGIGTIAESLAVVDHASVRRFLDVGCNYGFGLDLARRVYGWEVVGVEPTLAGIRGRKELGLDIRAEYLGPDSEIGDNFDLIVATEVVEHVTDPLGFLRAIASRLNSKGHAVLTTPAAEIVERSNPESEIVAALSPGNHVFIASEPGFELLLRNAGFSHISVTRNRGTLHAVVGNTALGVESHAQPITREALQDYYSAVAARAKRGSALATGMAIRDLRLRVARGDYFGIDVAVRRAVKNFTTRWKLNLRRPHSILMALTDMPTPPWSLAGVAFALGMIELSHRSRPKQAALYFDVSAKAAQKWRATVQAVDLDTVDLLFQSAYHRVLAMARAHDPYAATDAIELGQWIEDGRADRTNIIAAKECRLYVEIAVRDSFATDTELESRVLRNAPSLASSDNDEHRVAALDALLTASISVARAGRDADARKRFEECKQLASESRSVAETDAHGRSIVSACDAELAKLAQVSELR